MTTHAPVYSHFELARPLDHKMMLWKFRDDISNGSGVIMLTDKLTDRQADKHAKRLYWKQYHPVCARGKNVSARRGSRCECQ